MSSVPWVFGPVLTPPRGRPSAVFPGTAPPLPNPYGTCGQKAHPRRRVLTPRLQRIIHRNDGAENCCTERDGWCLPKTSDNLRDTMSLMIRQTIRSKRPGESRYGVKGCPALGTEQVSLADPSPKKLHPGGIVPPPARSRSPGLPTRSPRVGVTVLSLGAKAGDGPGGPGWSRAGAAIGATALCPDTTLPLPATCGHVRPVFLHSESRGSGCVCGGGGEEEEWALLVCGCDEGWGRVSPQSGFLRA